MSSFQLINNPIDPFDGDLQITNNSITLTTGKEAIRQHLQVRFRFFLGEWFLDESEGVPWFRDILIKHATFSVVNEVLKGVILDTPGVLELVKFDFSYNSTTRNVTLEFQCLTTEGIY